MTEINMTLSNIGALFSILLIGGLIPSISSLTVFSISSRLGFVHGAVTTMGIVLGDIIFILLSIFGLALIAEYSAGLFVAIKFLGAAYLIWLGTMQWQADLQLGESKKIEGVSLLSSFLTGLFITLADQKAILFYLGFFPALIDLSNISIIDTSIILIVTIMTLGSAKLCYAVLGRKTAVFIHYEKTIIQLNKLLGLLLITVGCYIMLTTSAT